MKDKVKDALDRLTFRDRPGWDPSPINSEVIKRAKELVDLVDDSFLKDMIVSASSFEGVGFLWMLGDRELDVTLDNGTWSIYGIQIGEWDNIENPVIEYEIDKSNVSLEECVDHIKWVHNK